jgi:hypothetical protein
VRRNAVAIGLGVGIVIGLVAVVVGIADAAVPRASAPARLFVNAQEYSLITSRQTLEPGDVTELRAMLRRGKWKLWCSLPGHAKAGMRATLIVRP